jgi:hypothetical protein
MSSRAFLRAEMAEIAAAAGSVDQRAEALLGSLRGVIPYAAAWIGVRDPETRAHRRVGSDGDVDSLTRYFALPEADDELEAMGLNRFQPPVPASALPVPLADTRAWGEYLLPAGFNDGVAMALFTDDGRHLGFLSLLTGDSRHRTASYSGVLASLRPIIVKALDRLPSFASAAQLTGDAVAGIAITRAGRGVRVPGLPTHPLLGEGSSALAVARRYARAPGTVSSFLSPWAGGLLRVSVLDCRDETADHLCSLVLIRPAGDAALLGLSDVRLLGALVEGWDDERIRKDLGLSDPSGYAQELARHLALPSAGALVQYAAREGLCLPPCCGDDAGSREATAAPLDPATSEGRLAERSAPPCSEDTRRRRDVAALPLGPDRGQRPGRRLQLVQQVLHVRCDGARGHGEPSRDLLVRAAVHQEPEHRSSRGVRPRQSTSGVTRSMPSAKAGTSVAASTVMRTWPVASRPFRAGHMNDR